MSSSTPDFLAPPPGPPPPEVPPGWVARWDPRYNTFFYVNLATKQAQWEKPPGTIDRTSRPSSAGAGPSTSNPERLSMDSRPPPYTHNAETTNKSSTSIPQATNEKSNAPQPYSSLIPPSTQQQYPPHSTSPSPPESSSSKPRSGGLAGKISKFLSSHAPPRPPHGYPASTGGGFYQTSHQPYYGAPQYGPQPQMLYGGGMGRPMMFSGGGGRRPGMGAGGAAALGMGGGLLGGMMLADAMDNDYQDGFQDGADYGGGDYGGGDFGGGDFGGGDF